MCTVWEAGLSLIISAELVHGWSSKQRTTANISRYILSFYDMHFKSLKIKYALT